MIAQDLIGKLICLVCRKPLALKADRTALICGECHRAYPIRDNIPILIIDEARIEPV